jgi:hypothetical protein
MSSDHKIKKCVRCLTVIDQCRCMQENKKIVFVSPSQCPKCSKELEIPGEKGKG